MAKKTAPKEAKGASEKKTKKSPNKNKELKTVKNQIPKTSDIASQGDKEEINFSCSECASRNCYRNDKQYPTFCLTLADKKGAEETKELYLEDNEDSHMLKTASEVEAEFYGRMTRVEETIVLAKKLGIKKLGIASCFALLNEASLFAKCARSADLEPRTVICKIGSLDKCDIGIPEEMKLAPGSKEASCNPILQAKTLNAWGSELNVMMGLCVGHDTLFNKYSQAPVTTLVVKDRVLAHNPVAAFYLSKTFYARILDYNKYPKSRLAKK